MPHGIMLSNHDRSVFTLRPNPCMVTPRLTRMPIAATLPRLGPHAGESVLRPGVDPEGAERVDERLLHRIDVALDPFRVREAMDRVSDELAGTVERDVPAPVDVEQLGSLGRQKLFGDEQVRVRGVASDRVDGRVLDEEEVVVVGPTGGPALVDRFLKVPRLLVRQATQPAGPKCVGGSEAHATRVGTPRTELPRAVPVPTPSPRCSPSDTREGVPRLGCQTRLGRFLILSDRLASTAGRRVPPHPSISQVSSSESVRVLCIAFDVVNPRGVPAVDRWEEGWIDGHHGSRASTRPVSGPLPFPRETKWQPSKESSHY